MAVNCLRAQLRDRLISEGWGRRYWNRCTKCALIWGNDVPDHACPKCQSVTWLAIDLESEG